MLQVMIAGGLALSLLGAPYAGESAAGDPKVSPPTDKIVVDLITINGSGCPEGTVAVAVSPDNTAFTVTYSKYLAQVGPSLAPALARVNCQLAVQVHVPQGFTYAIASADYRGFAHVEKGAIVQEQADYYFQGNPQTTYVTHTFDGPMDDNFQVTDKTELAATSYLPCGEKRYLNINTELRAYGGTSDTTKLTSYITMDSTDLSVSTEYTFAWLPCPQLVTSR